MEARRTLNNTNMGVIKSAAFALTTALTATSRLLNSVDAIAETVEATAVKYRNVTIQDMEVQALTMAKPE